MATSLVRFGGWVGFGGGLNTPCNRTPRISKLLYAYDVMLICKAKVAEIKSLIGYLETYCRWFGRLFGLLAWDSGSFIRLRVAINISQPLCRVRLITLDNDEVHWVSFKYERLPNVCYWCGCLTHQDKDCEKWIDSEGSLSKEDQHFGPWLRATPVTTSKKGSLSVP